MAIRVVRVVLLLALLAGDVRAQEQPSPTPPPSASFPVIVGVKVGDVVRLDLRDGHSVEGRVLRISEPFIKIASDSMRLGQVSIALEEIVRCEITVPDVPSLPVNCFNPFCSPAWASNPDRIALWIDGSAGMGGTNRSVGSLYGVALSYGLDEHRVVRGRWIQYQDREASIIRIPQDSFDTYALLYGMHARHGRGFALATAGPGYSQGAARGKRLYSNGETSWHKPLHYQAVSLVGEGQAGLAWQTVGLGVGVVGDANPRRQTWAWQVFLSVGAVPKYRDEEDR